MRGKKSIGKLLLIIAIVPVLVITMSIAGCKTTTAETTAATETTAVATTAAPATTAAAEETTAAAEATAAAMPLDELAISKAKELAAGKDITLKAWLTWDAPGAALEKVIPEWIAATGIKVEYERLSTLEMEQKMNLELASGETGIDIFQYDGYIRAPLLENPAVMNLDPFIEKYPIDFSTMIPKIEDFALNTAGVHAGLPFYWCNYTMVYRKDLIDDPKEQAAFETKYGYKYDIKNLTWDKSYKDVAEFFTRDTNNDGKTDLFGTAEMGAPWAAGDCFMSQYLNRWNADKPFMFDTSTKKCTINDPEARATLDVTKWLIDNKYMVPEYLQTDWASILGVFGSGKAALAFQYTPTWVPLQAVSSDFPISGPDKVGFTSVPGIEGKPRSTQDCVWLSFIPKTSPNAEIAYLFLAWASSDKIDKEMAMTTLHNPLRVATYQDPEVIAANPSFAAEFEHPEGLVHIPAIIIYSETQKILSDYMAAIASGTESVDDAVNKTASEIEAKWVEIMGE